MTETDLLIFFRCDKYGSLLESVEPKLGMSLGKVFSLIWTRIDQIISMVRLCPVRYQITKIKDQEA